MWTLFDDADLGDRLVGWACLFIAGLLIGMYCF
jgi:hypothetical protein